MVIDERQRAEAALAQLDSADNEPPAEWPPVARRIREARERSGLTQAILAARLGIAPSEYWHVELHDDEAFTCMSVAELGQIAEILGMSLHVILFGPTADRLGPRTTLEEPGVARGV